jgi:hypothetical protein
MSVVPKKLLEKIQWAEAHIAPFTTNAVAIGTTVLEATAFETKTEAARAALTAAENARNASKDATNALKAAIEALDVAAAGIVKQVRVKAETTHNPAVYSLASIPAPSTPGPVGAPGKTKAFEVAVRPDGSLDITWECVNPPGCHGVIYQVYRRIEATESYQYLGGTGKKSFTDTTVPSGVPSVMYQIQATRSTSIGVANDFTVNFGVGSGGIVTASVAAGKPAKIAA